MKPIKNVFPACESSEKGYLVKRSESTLILVGQKRDEDKTPIQLCPPFYNVTKTHCFSGDCSASELKEKQKH